MNKIDGLIYLSVILGVIVLLKSIVSGINDPVVLRIMFWMFKAPLG